MSDEEWADEEWADEEWAFVAPSLTLLRQEAGQRQHGLREVFNALRWIVRTGAPWRLMPHDFPPWAEAIRGVLWDRVIKDTL